MRTYYFARAKILNPSTNNLVSIAAKTPTGFPGRHFPKLAPSYNTLMAYKSSGNKEKYIKEYKEQLSKLDVHKVAQVLGPDAILVCYETPDKFCHRHLVADWLRENGYQISEM